MRLSGSNGSLICKTNGGKLPALVCALLACALTEHGDADSRTQADGNVFIFLIVAHVQVPPT